MLNETTGVWLPDCVLDFTEGKRALICGGQGAREDHRQKLQKTLELDALDWFSGERGSEKAYNESSRAMMGGKYDILFVLVAYSSHQCMPVTRLAKANGVTVIMIPSGYSVNSFTKAIEEQACRSQRAAPEGPASWRPTPGKFAQSSGQVVASMHAGRSTT